MADMDQKRLRQTVARAEVALRSLADPGSLWRFAVYTLGRFLNDGCPRAAASLSYATLLALVPLLAIGLAVLTAFPVFDSVRDQIQDLIVENFLPETSTAVSDYLSAFLRNARSMTGPGVAALGVTAVLLLSTINSALNVIWRVAEERSLVLRVLVYWAMLTLGPLLVGTSMSLSGYAFAAVQWAGIEDYTSDLVEFSRLISIGLATLGFGLIFFVVPNRSIEMRHAMLGGLVAAVIFEGLKYAFGAYLVYFPTYQAIYGALSTIPIFLIWMYLSWAVVLFGAEVAAALPEWRTAYRRGRNEAASGERLALALSIITRLDVAQKSERQLRHRDLVEGLPATPGEGDKILMLLHRNKLVARSLGGRWILARDLRTVTLGDLTGMLGLDLNPGKGWVKGAEEAVAALSKAGRGVLERPLEDLLDEAEPPWSSERLEVV